MTFRRNIDPNKYCYVYCGPEACNCGRGDEIYLQQLLREYTHGQIIPENGEQQDKTDK